MKKIIYLLFLLLLFPLSSIFSNPSFVYQFINPTSGEYQESWIDFQIPDTPHLIFLRTYTSSQTKWTFNHPFLKEDYAKFSQNSSIAYEYEKDFLSAIKTAHYSLHFTYQKLEEHLWQCDVFFNDNLIVTYQFYYEKRHNMPSFFLLQKVIYPNQKQLEYTYDFSSSHPVIMSRHNLLEKEVEIQYEKATNPFPKVQQFWKKSSPNNDHLCSFSYHANHTEVLDENNQKTIYYYTKKNQLTTVEHYEDNNALVSQKKYFWDDKNELQKQTLEDENGNILSEQDYTISQQSVSNFFESIWSWIKSCFCFEEKCLSYLQNVGNDMIGEDWMDVIANCQDPSTVGTFVGNGELHKNKRITVINGSLNAKRYCQKVMEKISQSHGNNNVHYVYRATGGWTKDVVSCVVTKLSITTYEAKLLAQLWKKLIQDMGGTESGGTIFHYAHSIGGSETALALKLLTPEEKQMLKIITFGSTSLIRDKDVKKIINCISKRDPICLMDFVGYIQAVLHHGDHSIFVGTCLGGMDHFLLDSESYMEQIYLQGEEFLQSSSE